MQKRVIPVQFEELKSSGSLPSPAGVGIKILEITRTDDFSAADMGQAIMSDSSLTGRILELANTADRAGQEPITTVSAATMRLGATTVRSLALAFSIISERDDGACKAFNYPHYWSRSLARAVAAKALARRVPGVSSEEAYVAGLLAEVGVLALATAHSETYARVLLETRDEPRAAVREAEQRAFDIDHSVVSYCMMMDWGLPEGFANEVESFNVRPTFGPDEGRLETVGDLLRFADAIASAMLFTATTPARKIHEVGAQMDLLQGVLDCTDDELAGLVEFIALEWVRWGERLDIATCGVSYRRVTETIDRGRRAFAEEQELQSGGGLRCESLVAANIEAPVEAVEDARDLGAERIKVLAVDDDPVALRVLEGVLRGQGFDVVVARNGVEAMRLAVQESPDIIVADQEMPEMSGLELTQALRRSKRGASMYIVLLTGASQEALLVEAFDAGVDDFIEKPFEGKFLIARLKAGMRIVGLQRRIEEDRRTILKQIADQSTSKRQLEVMTHTDLLTGIPNRRHAMTRIEEEWAACERSGGNFAMTMVDVDRFKSVNDRYGHDVGDAVLKATAQTISGMLRGVDRVARLGGEEFLIISRSGSMADARILAERARLAVEENLVETEGFRGSVTISLGLASFDQGYGSVTEMLKAADEAVYQAKNSGRNRVCVAREFPQGAEEPAAERRSA